MNNKMIIGLALALCSTTYSQGYKIVDTGISENYNDQAVISAPSENTAFYGQDAQYLGNQPSYTDNGDGTVSDNVTGLMWQSNMGDKMSHAEALKMADTLNFAGYNDWRVPSIKELYSLILFSGQVAGEKAIKLFIDTNYFYQPLGDTALGLREIDAQTWTTNQYKGLTMNGDTTVFGVNFVDGRIKGYPKYNPANKSEAQVMYFRLVRGNTSYGQNDFVSNNDGSITDQATGLMWQQADDGNTYDWKDALAYCEDLSLANQSDWRLPNIKELNSILDYEHGPQSTGSAAIDPLFSATEITDPDGNSGQYSYYWSGTSHLDGANPYTAAAYFAFGEAQGEMNGTLMDVHGAGSQRSDPKSGSVTDYPDYWGPQGDVRYVYNAVRCVRSGEAITPVTLGVGSAIQMIEANGVIYVNSSKGLSKITLFNSKGDVLFQQNVDGLDAKISTQSIANSAYLVKVEDVEGVNYLKSLGR